MRKIMLIALFACLCLAVDHTKANPYPPVWISEFSTQEDWIELYVEGKLNLGTFVVINADTVAIDTLAVTMFDRYYVVLDQTNTSGFDLPEGGGSIELVYDNLRYGTGDGKEWWDWAPAPVKGSTVAAIGRNYTPPITWCLTDTPTKGAFNELYNIMPRNYVIINEIYPKHNDNDEYFLEIYNVSDTAINLYNWKIFYLYEMYSIENIEIGEKSFYSIRNDFPESSEQSYKTVILMDDMFFIRDIVDWQRYQPGISYSRYPDGTFEENPSALIESIPTPGAPNRLKEIAVADKPPISITLHQNTPNPFNPRTAIPVTNDRSGHVTLTVYNVTGQAVRTLYDGILTAGYHSFIWDGRDSAGNDVASGVYVYRIDAGQFSESRTMALVR